VREALGRLAADGLVELLPNRGARVATVGAADMEAAYLARAAVEPAAARLAAERVAAGGADGTSAVAAMHDAIRAHRAVAADAPAAAFTANRAFHLALVRGAANPYLARFAETLWAGRVGLAVYTAQAEPPEWIEHDIADHEAIAAAVAAGDGAGAEERTARHIRCALGLLADRLAEGAARR